MTVKQSQAVEREILRPLWKVHILHHAGEGPILGHWMIEELREHGYRVSPGTLYPLLARLTRLGWLKSAAKPNKRGGKKMVHYRLTEAGRAALNEVRSRLGELQGEVSP